MKLTRLLGLLLLVSVACSPANQAPTAPAQTGGQAAPAEKRSDNQVLRIAQVGLPASLNPEASAANQPVYNAMYDALITLDDKLNVVPAAAEKWEATSPTTYKFTLRKDMTFSNGDKLTAADVEFTFAFFKERNTPQMLQFPSVSNMKALDDYTVELTNKAPDASSLAGMAWLWVMPKKYFESVGRDGFTAKPMGSGPYELVDFKNADMAHFKLRTTPHPFRKPIATELTIRSITEKTATVAGLQTGELDGATGSFTADQLNAIEKAGILTEKKLTQNLAGLFPMSEMDTRPGPTKDKRVRMALNYAVDKETIAKSFYRGEALANGQISVPSSPMWDPNLKAYPYDPAMAKKLLADAGYPNGFTLPGGLDFTPQTASADVMQVVQSNLRDVGVQVQVNSFELAVFLDRFYGRNGQSKGDIFFATYVDTNGFAPPIRGNLSCDKPANNIWWCNKDFDKLMSDAAVETDIVKRTAIMQKATKALTDDVSHIYLIVVPGYVALNPKIKGFKWTSDAFYNFDSVYRIE